jgi:outer membrane protein OmpA-like peptidoglycan-associated protein
MKSPSFAGAVFMLIGHTDAQGSDEYNLDLSTRRAFRLAEYLVKECGIPDARIRKEGHGERELKSTGNTEQDHAINRRVEVRLIP